jgi:HK97 family phage portal protein
LAQEQFAAGFLKNGGQPSGIVKAGPNLSAEGMERLRGEIEGLYAGPRRAGRIAILGKEMEWTQLGLALGDAEFLAQRRFAVEEVARWFGTPPQRVGDTSKQTFANFEQANL